MLIVGGGGEDNPKRHKEEKNQLPYISFPSDSTGLILVHILPELSQCSHMQVYHTVILHVHISKLDHIYLLSFHILKIQSFSDQGNCNF